MNSFNQLISQIKSANYAGANQTFAEIMQQKVADRLAVERKSIFTEADELSAAGIDAKAKEAELGEDEMTSAEKAERERLVKGMKKGDWSRYGSRAKDVMYATATKKAME